MLSSRLTEKKGYYSNDHLQISFHALILGYLSIGRGWGFAISTHLTMPKIGRVCMVVVI